LPFEETLLRIKSQKDFFAGLMFSALGAAFAIGAWSNYTIGDAARMGPGYFPLLLGSALAVLGLFVIFTSLVVETEDGDKIGSIAWRPLGFIIGANVLFGVLLAGVPRLGIPAFGLIAAIFGLTFVASMAGDDFRPKEVAVLAAVLALLSYLAFVVLLKLQFPVWPSFLVG
jgi:hypothetical protein